MRTFWLQLVLFEDVPAYLAKGWIVEDSSPSRWSVIMRWCGEGEPT